MSVDVAEGAAVTFDSYETIEYLYLLTILLWLSSVANGGLKLIDRLSYGTNLLIGNELPNMFYSAILWICNSIIIDGTCYNLACSLTGVKYNVILL